jgi:hypothetical protein
MLLLSFFFSGASADNVATVATDDAGANALASLLMSFPAGAIAQLDELSPLVFLPGRVGNVDVAWPRPPVQRRMKNANVNKKLMFKIAVEKCIAHEDLEGLESVLEFGREQSWGKRWLMTWATKNYEDLKAHLEEVAAEKAKKDPLSEEDLAKVRAAMEAELVAVRAAKDANDMNALHDAVNSAEARGGSAYMYTLIRLATSAGRKETEKDGDKWMNKFI